MMCYQLTSIHTIGTRFGCCQRDIVVRGRHCAQDRLEFRLPQRKGRSAAGLDMRYAENAEEAGQTESGRSS